MDKSFHLRPRPDVFLFLAKNGMAEVTILGNDLAVSGFVVPAVTAETPGRIEMTDMVG